VQEAQPVLAAPVAWQEQLPVPGTLVKLRVRGMALAALEGAGDRWELQLGGQSAPAAIRWPEDLAAPEPFALDYTIKKNSKGLTLLIDRGETMQPFDHLALEFTNVDTTTKVTPYSSADGTTYTQVCSPQLVFQRVANGRIMRLTSLRCNPGPTRYLKLVLEAPSSTQVSQLSGWQAVVADPNEYYELPVSFGAPLKDVDTGLPLIPLSLGSNDVPLRKLKLDSTAQEPVAVRLVRLSPSGAVIRTVLDSVWAKSLQGYGLTQENTTLEFDDPVQDGATWALELQAQPAVALDKVQAWAAEVYIICTMPEQQDAVLALNLPQPRRSSLAEPARPVLNLAELPLAGELSDAAPAKAHAPRLPGKLGVLEADAGRELRQWQMVLIYGVSGILLALIGVAILRRGRRQAN
jgi:hypothetical protein